MSKSESRVDETSASSDAVGRQIAGDEGPESGEQGTIHRPLSSEESGGSEANPVLEDLNDRRVGDFHLLRRLGRGGMAEVYLAEQISLKRRVAVKVLRKDHIAGSDDVMVRRFRQEAEAVAGLNHPNIIQVFAIGEETGIHYIAQEYVQGMNLREFLSKKGPPDVQVALHIMRQVAAALQAAGDAGIVHRDIKPENIMVTPKGKVKVADFGLAQLSQQGERVNLTQVGITMGTPLYMSPEQINGQKLDPRSDLYSFGVTCYHLLAGQPPFRGETAISIAVQHLKEPPKPIVERRPDLPKPLVQVIERMMAKSPDDRYPNAAAVLNDLKLISKTMKEQPGAASDLKLAAFAPTRGTAPRHSNRMIAWGLRRPVAAFVLSCLLVGSASAGVGWLLRTDNPLGAPVTAASRVPNADNVQQQFLKAKFLGDDEEAWKAVLDYWPEETSWRNSAKGQMGLLYFRSGRTAEAERLFNELVALGDSEPAHQALGFAGQALIASYRGQHDESQRIIAFHLEPLREHLDAETAALVRDTIGRNRQVLGDRIKQGYEDQFRVEGAEGTLP